MRPSGMPETHNVKQTLIGMLLKLQTTMRVIPAYRSHPSKRALPGLGSARFGSAINGYKKHVAYYRSSIDNRVLLA